VIYFLILGDSGHKIIIFVALKADTYNFMGVPEKSLHPLWHNPIRYQFRFSNLNYVSGSGW